MDSLGRIKLVSSDRHGRSDIGNQVRRWFLQRRKVTVSLEGDERFKMGNDCHEDVFLFLSTTTFPSSEPKKTHTQRLDYVVWEGDVEFDADENVFNTEYKYIILGNRGDDAIWLPGENLRIKTPKVVEVKDKPWTVRKPTGNSTAPTVNNSSNSPTSTQPPNKPNPPPPPPPPSTTTTATTPRNLNNTTIQNSSKSTFVRKRRDVPKNKNGLG